MSWTLLKKKRELALTWPTRDEDKRWGLWRGGYTSLSWYGFRILQRFAEWGVASIGDQHEAIARLEFNVKPVHTAGLIHVELFNPDEARIFLIQLKVWKGWDLFFIVNLGVRHTATSRSVRANKMREIMLGRAKREQAERLSAQKRQAALRKKLMGHPWPPARATR